MKKMKSIAVKGLIAAGTIAAIMSFTGCSASCYEMTFVKK